MNDYAVIGRAVAKTYAGDRPTRALGPIDIDVRGGEVLALVGASGSGKSTLLHLMAGLSKASSGSLRVMGLETTTARPNELARLRSESVGIVFQDFYLDATKTALENVQMPLLYQGVTWRARRERAVELLGRVGLGARSAHRPPQLSGGEKQRVAIARALVTQPGLLLADEPTGNLDSASESTALELLLSLAREDAVAVIIATHSARVAEAADTITALEDGYVVT